MDALGSPPLSLSFEYSYGFSRARYVYSLISGVGIFFLGAGVTCYHGILNLVHPPTLEALPIVSDHHLHNLIAMETVYYCSHRHFQFLVHLCWWSLASLVCTTAVQELPHTLHTSHPGSLWTALKQVRKSADESGASLKDYGMQSRCALLRD